MRNSISTLRQQQGEKGAVLAEFATILPVVLLFLFAMQELGVFVRNAMNVHSISNQIANLVIRDCIMDKRVAMDPGPTGSAADIASYQEFVTTSNGCFNADKDLVSAIPEVARIIYKTSKSEDEFNESNVKGSVLVSLYDWNPGSAQWVRRATYPKEYKKVGNPSRTTKLSASISSNAISSSFGTLVAVEVFADHKPIGFVGKLPGIGWAVPKSLYYVTIM